MHKHPPYTRPLSTTIHTRSFRHVHARTQVSASHVYNLSHTSTSASPAPPRARTPPRTRAPPLKGARTCRTRVHLARAPRASPAAQPSARGAGARGLQQRPGRGRPAVTSLPALQKLGCLQQALHVDHPHPFHGYCGWRPGLSALPSPADRRRRRRLQPPAVPEHVRPAGGPAQPRLGALSATPSLWPPAPPSPRPPCLRQPARSLFTSRREHGEGREQRPARPLPLRSAPFSAPLGNEVPPPPKARRESQYANCLSTPAPCGIAQ